MAHVFPAAPIAHSGLTELASAISSDKLDINVKSVQSGVEVPVSNPPALASGTPGTSVVKVGSAARSEGTSDLGIPMMAVQTASASSLCDANLDYTVLQTDSSGQLRVATNSAVSFATALVRTSSNLSG